MNKPESWKAWQWVVFVLSLLVLCYLAWTTYTNRAAIPTPAPASK